MPQVPTLKEAGYNLDAYAWYCVVAPTGTPVPTVDKLNKTINEILDSKEFAARAAQLGVVRRGGTPQDLGHFIRAEYDKWAPLITELGLAKKF
jgi:tripartite-type tricarboxylate transporter receptor subunit TctC